MKLYYQVHNPLLNRLQELVQQRPFYAQSPLGWITGNYLDRAYLERLIRIAPVYGAGTLIFDEGYFEWAKIINENPSVGNWLAEMAEWINNRGIKLGVLVSGPEEKKKLEKEIISRRQVPVEVYAQEGSFLLDGIATRFGGGRLPYLFINTLLEILNGHGMGKSSCPGEEGTASGAPTEDKFRAISKQPILVRVDRPGAAGEDLGSWGNVFGISYSLPTGISDPKIIEEEYLKICFGSGWGEVKKAFDFARQAIEKSFLTLGSIDLMENGCWPRNLDWLDRQLGMKSFNITREVLSQIDLEKIEGMEAAHDAWKTLESVRPQIEPKAFLWLEHFFQQLKTVCQILRLLAETYFAHRGLARATLKIPGHVLWSKYKDFAAAVREHQALLQDFDSKTPAAGAQPLENILMAIKP
jgi:hypothetical protein